jgi:hypothetical protein
MRRTGDRVRSVAYALEETAPGSIAVIGGVP